MGGTVFFDYDGTLHDSMHLYGPAFRRAYAALVTDGWAAPRTFSDEEIASWLGYSPAAMWASFMPELPEAIWQRASAAIGEEMRRLLAAGAGRLYPGAKAMLESLREEGCTLVFLSNCSGSYRDEHLAAFGLGGLFTGAWCAEDFEGLEKWQIYRQICARYPKPHLMVGDRSGGGRARKHSLCRVHLRIRNGRRAQPGGRPGEHGPRDRRGRAGTYREAARAPLALALSLVHLREQLLAAVHTELLVDALHVGAHGGLGDDERGGHKGDAVAAPQIP